MICAPYLLQNVLKQQLRSFSNNTSVMNKDFSKDYTSKAKDRIKDCDFVVKDNKDQGQGHH